MTLWTRLALLLLLDQTSAYDASLTSDDDAFDSLIRDHHQRQLSTYADGGTEQACWYNKEFVACNVFYGSTELNMGPVWDQYAIWGNYTVTEGDTIRFTVSIDNFNHTDLTALSHANSTAGDFVIKSGKELIEHANFHACTIESGFCTPLLGVTPGLITHAPAWQPVQSLRSLSMGARVRAPRPDAPRGDLLVRSLLREVLPWATAPCEPHLAEVRGSD